MDDGTTVVELNGRNVTADPFDPGNGTGLWLTAGHYNFAFEPDGDLVPLNGHGLLVDIIELF